MRAPLENPTHVAHRYNVTTLAKGIAAGLLGGLLGTIAMDLAREGTFAALNLPAGLSFSVIGDAAAAFLSRLGITLTGGAPLGTVLYYLIGLILGASLGAATHGIGAFRVTSIKRAIGLSILYVEAMSLPMLTVAAVILKLTASETAQWFGISFVIHLVYGLVLGLVIGLAYRPGLAVPKDSSARG